MKMIMIMKTILLLTVVGLCFSNALIEANDCESNTTCTEKSVFLDRNVTSLKNKTIGKVLDERKREKRSISLDSGLLGDNITTIITTLNPTTPPVTTPPSTTPSKTTPIVTKKPTKKPYKKAKKPNKVRKVFFSYYPHNNNHTHTYPSRRLYPNHG